MDQTNKPTKPLTKELKNSFPLTPTSHKEKIAE